MIIAEFNIPAHYGGLGLPVAFIPRAFAQGLFAFFVDATAKPVVGTSASVLSNAVLANGWSAAINTVAVVYGRRGRGVQPPLPNMLALSLFLRLHLWEPAAQDWPVRREHMLQRTSA